MELIVLRNGEEHRVVVEEVLTGMPAVADAAVVGRPDQQLGETVAALRFWGFGGVYRRGTPD